MRMLSVAITSILLLASGPVFAQQVALTQAKPDCPPGEPDSLQISWTQPCDSGTWLFDTEAGCRMWDWHPEPEDLVVWKGACHAGLPTGRGEAQWFEHGRPIDRFTGTYRDGKREGEGHYAGTRTSASTASMPTTCRIGVAQIEGETLAGDWNKGCLSAGGKVAAIGVPRTSCGTENARPPKVAGVK